MMKYTCKYGGIHIRVLIKSTCDQKIWTVPFCMLNLQGIEEVHTSVDPQKKLDRNSVKVGDRVGYRDRNQHEVYGIVAKLNPKTAMIKLAKGEEWLVYYQHLIVVLEGEATFHASNCFIDGEIVRENN